MAKSPKDDPISTGGPGGENPPALPATVDPTPATSIAVPVKQGERREHKATYATDKRNGGYLVRVIGPHANKFVGKIVPVVRRDDTEEQEELTRVVWTGVDTGTPERPGTGKPVALYTFAPKPKVDDDILF